MIILYAFQQKKPKKHPENLCRDLSLGNH